MGIATSTYTPIDSSGIDYDKEYMSAADYSALQSLKSQWSTATAAGDTTLADSLHSQAEALRSKYNYAGGTDGSQYLYSGTTAKTTGANGENTTLPTGFTYANYQDSAADLTAQNLLDQLANYGSFSYDVEAPTYTNQYAEQQAALLDEILNREDFSWSKEDDPQWSSYKKSYLREGERATANALAQASAASGGQASSYAVNAATQAGDYYATQLNDIIPTLYQQAYEQYLNEYSMKQQDLSAVNTQEQLDYSKYLDALSQYNTDRNLAYNTWNDDYSHLSSSLSAAQSLANDSYSRYLDSLNLSYSDYLTQQELTQSLAALGASAGDYSLYSDLGMSDSMIAALTEKYGADAAQAFAEFASQYGDNSLAAGLGVDTSYADAYQTATLESMQNTGWNLLSMGVMPSEETLNAMGMTTEQAQKYISGVNAGMYSSGSSGGSSSSSGSSGSSSGSSSSSSGSLAEDALAWAAQYGGDPETYVKAHYKEYGFSSQSIALAALAMYQTEDAASGSTGSSTLKYSQLSDAAKNIADLADSDLTTNYVQVLDLIQALDNEDEQEYLLHMIGY